MIPKYLIIHHSASSRDLTTVNMINEWHKVRWPGFISSLGYHIGYHYIITGDGKLTQTRNENEVGAHAKDNKMNFRSIGICLTGNFEEENPSEEQLKTLNEFILSHSNLEIISHQQVPSKTLCPGKSLLKWLENRNKEKEIDKNKVEILKKLVELYKKLISIVNGSNK